MILSGEKSKSQINANNAMTPALIRALWGGIWKLIMEIKKTNAIIGLAFPYRAFYVRPQVSCLIRCILALVAFVCLFPTGHCAFLNASSTYLDQIMQNHIVGIYASFSIVRLQMHPQIVCMPGCILTLFAFVWFFSAIFLLLQMCFQTDFCCWGILTLIAFVLIFSTVYFQKVSSNWLSKEMKSDIDCICLTSLRCAFSEMRHLLLDEAISRKENSMTSKSHM